MAETPAHIDSALDRSIMHSEDTCVRSCRDMPGNLPGGTEEILNAVHESVILYTHDLRIVWANKGTGEMLDLDVGEIVGHCCREVLHDCPEPCETCPVRKSFQSGRSESACFEYRTGRFADLRTLPLFEGDGSVGHVLTFSSNATEKVKPDGEAVRIDHLSLLGELAAGVAHEINNPINGIINYAQLLVNRLPPREAEADIATRIIVEGERIAGIVQSLLTFAGNGTQERIRISLIDLLSDCLSLTQAQIQEDGIRLQLDIEADLPHLYVNGRQMRQVFLNLISNARHALNEKFPVVRDDKILRIGGKKIRNNLGVFLRVEFYDQGAGIPPESLDRVLKPFFSTKAVFKGIGLGLSTSRSILAQHNGTISVDSLLGAYTRVTLEVPVADG